jgi:non-ribosomal peptide synthetase component F
VGEGVTGLFLTSALFTLLAEEDPECLRGVHEIWAGGESISPRAVQRVLDTCPDTTVVNGYGPTETTTFATRFALRPPASVGATMPIGSALHGMGV